MPGESDEAPDGVGVVSTVDVDRDACEGHALCMVYAPEIFTIDDDEKAAILRSPIPEELLPGVEDAIGQCPVQAIRLVAGSA